MTRNTGGMCFLGVCDTSRGPTDARHEVEIFPDNKRHQINSDPLSSFDSYCIAFLCILRNVFMDNVYVKKDIVAPPLGFAL